MSDHDVLIDYEEDEETLQNLDKNNKSNGGVKEDVKKGSYVGVHSTGFRDFNMKAEIIKAITDCGFEHPSEVQQMAIPSALIGTDILCQAKSGMGKTAVFVLSILNNIEPIDGEVSVLILCHTRELAFQIKTEFSRFTKYLPNIRTEVFYGGTHINNNISVLKDKAKCPHILVGTPGRILALIKEKVLNLNKVKVFTLDECDKMLEAIDMRRDVQDIFKTTPHKKQVMMFTATLPKEMQAVCKKFMKNPLVISVDNQSKLTLHGLLQYYVKLEENAKNRKLSDLLDSLEFNQICIFVKSIGRAKELNKLLNQCNFPSNCIHGDLPQEERIARYSKFKDFVTRIMVCTDLFGRGIDVERVNIVINYDMPESADSYLHRVGRAGRFGTKGMAITFVSSSSDSEILNKVQEKFEVDIKEMPDNLDPNAYMNA